MNQTDKIRWEFINSNYSEQLSPLGTVKKQIPSVLIKKNYSLSAERCKAIWKFCSDSHIDIISLFTSAGVFYRSLVTGNNPQAINVIRNNYVAAAFFTPNENQIAPGFVEMVNDHLSASAEGQLVPGEMIVYASGENAQMFDSLNHDITMGIGQTQEKIHIAYTALSERISERMLDLTHERIMKITEQMLLKQPVCLGDIKILDENELNQVLCEFNNSGRDYPRNKTYIELFEEQVEKTPDHIALEFEEQRLSYRELNARANYLGKLLRERGVKPDSIVGLVTERSIEMMVGIYGVLKAGGAYLPIDPDLPINRIHYMLGDSGVNIVLEGTGSGHIISQLQEVEVISLEENISFSMRNLEHVSHPGHLAYVIYTSGTTGNPKGVMVENGNLVNLLLWMLEDGYNDRDVILQKTTYVFDLSIWELFIGYLSGAKLVLLAKEDEKDPARIASKMKEYGITRTSFVPSVLEEFLPYIDAGILKTLRRIQLSGEALPVELANRFNQICRGAARLVNSYGPTETTVFATSLDVPTDVSLNHINIGNPIANMQIYIRNGGILCGTGMLGELYIGGKGVTRGYLNRPELTADKFIDNPYRTGERIYRTGDLARWLEDGSIEYLGRIDEQVKIRGFRIELGEINSKLREIKGIENAAVISREDNGDKYLCAYIVGAANLELHFIKEQLSKSLPAYMIPTHLMQLDSLPVTRNGKLDKKALPKPEIFGINEYTAPRNEVEVNIAAAFAEVLGADRIGIDDNFFDLGGHSLRATRLVNLLERTMGTRFSLREVLTGKTVRKLAENFTLKQGAELGDYTPIAALPQKSRYEMSAAQKRMYVMNQMQSKHTAYNIPIIMQVEGKLDLTRLNIALKQLAQHHELLRTYFIQDKDQFLQMIVDSVEIKLELEERAIGVVTAELLETFMQPFDLGQAPLMRVKVVAVSENKSLLILDIHHIIYDEGSAEVLLGDLSRLYSGQTLSEQLVQYKDYSAWQNAKDMSKQEKYWLKEFSGEPPVLNLQTDYVRPQQQSHRGSSVTTLLTEEQKREIKAFSRETGATEYMIVLSVFMLLLSRYSRQESIVVGSPVAGRIHSDTQQMLGMFVNTLVIKGELKTEQSFLSFTKLMADKCLKAYEHQEYPFEQLVEKVGVQRDVSRNPLFDVMFVLQNNEEAALSLGSASLTPVHCVSTAAAFDLTVSMTATANGYELLWEYCTDLFKRETIEQMARHFTILLTNVLESPQLALGDIEMLGKQEWEQVLYSFNETQESYPNDKSVIALFEEQVERAPGQIAATFGEQTLTYGQLNARANVLGQRLRKKGVQPNSIVGLITERSLDMIVGIYGILKAGGAYLPIDPQHPLERIRFLIQDSAACVLLAGSGSEQVIKELPDMPVIQLVDCCGEADAMNLEHVAQPDDLAYVIYTSGTTGQPKGVMVENRNVVNLAAWQIKAGQYNKSTVMIQNTTYAFDGSVWEIFPIGLAGGQLQIISEAQHKDPAALLPLLPGKQIALIPSMFRILLEYAEFHGNTEYLRQLERLYLAAEPVTAELLEKYTALTGRGTEHIVNLYGPTEATVTASSYTFGQAVHLDSIPIGKPIFNTQIYIMNGTSLCGIGVPGELCIGGAGVARGYLNQPELTAVKFVANPYRPGERIYRTGDLARWKADGNIEYLGRMGEQVKIRGFRIELGEIENSIRELDGIRNAVVIARDDHGAGDQYLAGYVVGKNRLDANAIKKQLRVSLPEYMIPDYFIQLESLPITRNGKLDRRALPKPIIIGGEYTAPRNDMEVSIASAFAEVLSAERVGIDDSFFELGGHSLRVTKLVNLLEQTTGVRLSMRDVLTGKSVRNLAEKIQAEMVMIQQYTPIAVQPQSRSYEMSSTQKRLYILDQMQGNNITYNIPAVLKVKGKLDLTRLNTALIQLVQRHELLRTYFVQDDNQFSQRVEEQVDAELEYGEGQESEIPAMLTEFVRPFQLNHAPLMRVKAVQLAENEMLLLLDIHHMIYDDASFAVLMGDFSRLYKGESLPALRVQYKDYSVWQNLKDMSKQEKYWLEEFSGELPLLDLQTDFTRPQRQSHNGSSVTAVLSEKQKQAVKAFSRETGATEYMILLSVFMLLLSRYSRQDSIVVGSPISGRTHPDTQQMLGMFVNTLAIKGELQPEQSFHSFIMQMAEKCLNAYEHQEYPFEELVEKVGKDRDLSRNPLFDVMFVFQNNEVAELKLGNSTMMPMGFELNAAKFDLSVSIGETSGGYELNWEYCTDLFKRETIERMAGHFKALLMNALEYPQQALSDIELVSQQEREQILYSFNATEKPYPDNKTFIALFEEQVERSPEQVAVVFGTETLTYRQLNARANQLGTRLRKQGVGPDNIVGIMLGRSLEMIIAIYGVLKAGGAYLPIDPKHPLDRIRYMLQDSSAKVLLVGPGSEQTIEKFEDIPVIDLTHPAGSRMEVEVNLEQVAQPNHLAYVIYTSGTTGRPKGVMIENRNLVHLANWQANHVQMDGNSVMLQKSTYIFDAAVWEIFSCGLAGGRLELLSEEQNDDPEELLQLIARQGVTQALIVPSAFRVLLEYAEVHHKVGQLRTLERIYLGAEPVTADLLNKYTSLTGNGIDHLVNLYGPTEGTVCATSYDFSLGDRLDVVPIGKPLGNVQIYILNGNSVCGIGMPGELCIGGAGVARGYLNQPELTAEKFIANPYRPGERMYRTGDLARWMPDGKLEYLGRIGEQVKIRGFRIELGEIENRLRELEGVQEAVVIAREDVHQENQDKHNNTVNGDKYLCGYVVASEKLNTLQIKEQLGKNLPDYMIPAHLIQLEFMPVTSSGKLDKKALPKPEVMAVEDYTAPRDELEVNMVEVFQEILGAKQIGIDNSFYELGGDSIKAIRIVSKLREHGYEISVRTIMQSRTIRAIRGNIRKAETVAAEQGEVTGAVVNTPIQHEFFSSHLPKPQHFNQSFMLESKERITQSSLEQALAAIVQHHDMLRAIYPEGAQTIRPVNVGRLYELVSRDYTNMAGEEEIFQAIEAEANTIQSSIDVEAGPLFKVALFQTLGRDYLLLCIHHLVVDGVSWRIITEDLNQLYTALQSGKPEVLPAKTMSFQSWSEALRRYRESSELKGEIGYWQTVEQQVKEGRVASTAAEGASYGMKNLEVCLTQEQTGQLLYKAGRAYQTEINDLLLTALGRAVNQMTGQETLAFSMEGHGREPIGEAAAIDRTVGWFTSVYPAVLNGIGGSIREDIRQTKESLRRIPNHGMGYGVLKTWGETVLEGVTPDITFNYLGELGQEGQGGRFAISDAPRGADIPEENQFGTAISINGAVMNQELRMAVSYDCGQYSEGFMEELKDRFEAQLADVIAHCVMVRSAERIASNWGQLKWSGDDFDITQFIWAHFGEDSLLRTVQVGNWNYSVLFVENLNTEIRERITQALRNMSLFRQIPHYILAMDRHILSLNVMEEAAFRQMCHDERLDGDFAFRGIEAEKFKQHAEFSTIEQYTASTMQTSFLVMQGTTIAELIVLEGSYEKSSLIHAVNRVIQEQGVLRSSCLQSSESEAYMICEHAFHLDWHIPYLDLSYATTSYRGAIYDQIIKLKDEVFIAKERNILSKIIITKESEKQHIIHVVVHHSIWDKTSTQILKERVQQLLDSSLEHTLVKGTYTQYVQEINNTEHADLQKEPLAALQLQSYLRNLNEYVAYNANNKLERSVVSIFEMGPQLLKFYREKPWDMLMHVLRIVATENQLLPENAVEVPVFILQEDRRYMSKDYTNTLGEFLDLLPLSVDCKEDVVKGDMQGTIEKIQKKKERSTLTLSSCFPRKSPSSSP